MKIVIDVNSEAADDFAEKWLREYRETCVAELSRPLDQKDAIRTIAAIDVLLADLTVPA